MFLPQLRKITPVAREPALIVDVPRGEYRYSFVLGNNRTIVDKGGSADRNLVSCRCTTESGFRYDTAIATPGPLTIFLVGVMLLLLVARQKFRQFQSD